MELINKPILLSLILALFCLSGCSTTAVTHKCGNFWDNHTFFQLLGWCFFPRLMFWFFSVITGGLWFWVGVLFVPRIMVAFWATTYYFHSNPIICVIAWIVALSGESAEKSTARIGFYRDDLKHYIG